jgi:hypothetical protein
MSLLAGYDVVVEIARIALLRYIQASTVGGQALTAPTEITQGDLGSNGVDLIVLEDIDITLDPTQENWATIVVPFEDSMFAFKGTVLGPVKGTLRIHGFFGLDDAPGADKTVPLHVKQMAFFVKAVTHSFDETVAYSAQALSALTGRPTFEQDMNVDLGLQLASVPLYAGPTWLIDDTQNGTIGGRFCQLKIAAIGDQAIGLFGILLSRNKGQGDTTQKSGSAITKGENLAVSLAPNAFHDLVFCPNQAGAQAALLAKQPSKLAQYLDNNLPPDCGSASRFLMSDGNWLTGTSIAFDANVIHVNGSISHGKQGAYCFRIGGTFTTDLSFTVASGAIQPKLNPNPVATSLSLDVSWYCALLWIIGALIGGAISLLVVSIAATIAVTIVNVLVSSVKQKETDVSPIQIGFANIQFTNPVTITTEGLTLHGWLPTPAVQASAGRTATMNVSVTNPNQTVVKNGIYHYPGNVECKAKDFAYTEIHQDQVMVCTAQVTLLSRPRTFVWTIDDNPPVTLTGNSGTVTIHPNLELPQPAASNQLLGPHPVQVSYVISTDGSVLTVTDKNQYIYVLKISYDCTDKSGTKLSYWDGTIVDGDSIRFGSDYYEYVTLCSLALRILISKIRTLPQGVPRDGDPAGLSENQVIQVLRAGVLEGAPETNSALSAATARFGPTLRTALIESLVPSMGTIRG